MTKQKPPLWEVLRRAYDASPPAPADADNDWTDRHGYAAEIRAVRDWLVPEETEPPASPKRGNLFGMGQWSVRQHLRALLTAEADRAENNDVPTKQEPQ